MQCYTLISIKWPNLDGLAVDDANFGNLIKMTSQASSL